MLAIWVFYFNHPWHCVDQRLESFNDIMEESGMVQWLKAEAFVQEIGVQFPMPTVISNLVVV